MCSSGRWKGERGLCFVGNRVYLLLAVEVQSRSEQRLLVPFIHFSEPLVFFCFFFPFFFFIFIYLFFWLVCLFFLLPWFVSCTIYVFMFIFEGRESIGRVEHFIISPHFIFHLRREGEHLNSFLFSI